VSKPFYRQTWFIVVVSFAGSLLVCCVAGLILLAIIPPTHSSSSLTHHPTPEATMTPRPMTPPTYPPATIGQLPVLGGLSSAFSAAYPLESATFDNVSATFIGSDDTGTDGQKHITILEFTIPAYISDTQIAPYLAHFFPPDAAHTGDIAALGMTFHTYDSHALANTFPASMFVTDAGSAAPSGSFTWSCDATQKICTLTLGTH
jgi:hypothetical protein